MTVGAELGESDGRAGATIGLEGCVEDVLERIAAELVKGASLARVGFGRGSAGVGGSGEGRVSGSGVASFGTSAGMVGCGESVLLSRSASVGAGSAAVRERTFWVSAGLSPLAVFLGASVLFSES